MLETRPNCFQYFIKFPVTFIDNKESTAARLQFVFADICSYRTHARFIFKQCQHDVNEYHINDDGLHRLLSRQIYDEIRITNL